MTSTTSHFANRRRVTLLIASISLIAATGCEPVEEATPGVYAGASDQLTTGDAASRAEALSKRFQLVQRDR